VLWQRHDVASALGPSLAAFYRNRTDNLGIDVFSAWLSLDRLLACLICDSR